MCSLKICITTCCENRRLGWSILLLLMRWASSKKGSQPQPPNCCKLIKGRNNKTKTVMLYEGLQNWTLVVKDWPNFQLEGATLIAVRVFPSLVWTLKDKLWPFRYFRLCQFEPQFLVMASQLLPLDPLIHTLVISPAPPTLDIRTSSK